MNERLISFRIESLEGDTEKLVPEDKVVDEINAQIKDKKWVTLEGKDGSSDIITEPVKESGDAKTAKEDWQNVFSTPKVNPSNVKSAVVTKTAKGG